ncbi:hypothetical protein [Pseudomonas pharyngis]|uniref:hypothetical protein n=1 Tax=Pseudomonas pharyngis TaxID=2892333 RepID=UPI003FD31D63
MTIVASEYEIRAAIERTRPSPGTFQRLAEMFMCIKFAGQYTSLIPQGRKDNDQTIKGYPDAYARLPDGRLLVVEATVGDWRTHLAEDLEKLKSLPSPGVAEIAFFTMQDADPTRPQANANPTTTKPDVEYFRQELQKLGIPNEGIRFFFMNQLVSELRQTRFAKILYSLNLPVSVTPFENIDLLPYSEMEPSRDEYKNKQIVYKRRLNKVKKCLENHPITCISGRSGVGKTTLAFAAAHQWANYENRTAMYVDFRDTPDPSALVESITTLVKVFGDENTLFIIDNTHLLNPRPLAQIENSFYRAENKPKLLMISHTTPAKTSHTLPDGKQLKNAIIPISLETSDIESAYKFICKRITQSSNFYKPDKADLSQWILFAPDILTFCMALINEKEYIIGGMRPELSLKGTRDFINKNYISHCSLEERKNLATIATLATYEMVTSEMSLPTQPSDKLLNLGLITKTSTKDGAYIRYKIAHDKLGKLILEALDENPTLLLEETFERDPFQASFWVRRQLDRERLDSSQKGIAASVLRNIDSKLWNFSKDFSPNYVTPIASMYREAEVEIGFWDILPERINRYIDSNTNFLKGIPSYLTFVADRPELTKACWDKLEQSNSSNRFSMACQLSSAKSLGTLLVHAEKHGKKVLDWIVPAMTSKQNATAMAIRLSSVDPHPAENTLNTIQRLAPELFKLLRAELGNENLTAPFLNNLRKSNNKIMKQWLQRPILLELTLKNDTKSVIAIAFATKKIQSLRQLIISNTRTFETEKLIKQSIDFIFSEDNIKKPNRYTKAQFSLIMEYYADTRNQECNTFIQELHSSNKLTEIIDSMKPDALIATWSAMRHFRKNSKSCKLIKQSIETLLKNRLDSSHPPKKEMLEKLEILSKLVGFTQTTVSESKSVVL